MRGHVIDLADARFARDVAAAYRHGPAFLTRVLADFAARNGRRTELETVFRRAAALDPAAVAAAGADRGWPT